MLIKVLEPYLANMIAAGEVVERPASVVKELAENSIDAGATAVTVEIENGGVSYIKVSDNGSGIPREDVKTAFLRHATSKISSPQDLQAIRTLGFRGEALASICAVSKMEMVTRTGDDNCGVRVLAEAGEIKEENDAGCPQGTSITVRDLFFNTPARMKFLKRDATEGGYVEEYVRRLALGHPEVSFRFINGGREKLFTPGDSSLRNTAYTIYGNDFAKELTEVGYTGDGITVAGLIGTPTLYRKNRSFQSFFINGRYIVNRTLTTALEEAYKNQLISGSFPVAILHIGVSPEFVDVNVHPAKLEVKFADENRVFQAVYWACKNALDSSFSLPEVRFQERHEKKAAPVSDTLKINSIQSQSAPPQLRARLSSVPPKGTNVLFKGLPRGFDRMALQRRTEEAAYTKEPQTEGGYGPPAELAAQQKLDNAEDGGFKIIGQLFNTYVLVEKADALYLIDQHAAHERLLYEELLERRKNRAVSSQLMLTPVVVSLSPVEAAAVRDNMAFFQDLGFELEDFGNNDIAVRQAPYASGRESLRDMVAEIAGMLAKGSAGDADALAQRALYTVACKAAVKAKRPLNEQELETLFKDVSALEGINTCPHGRPFTVRLTRQEIEKLFKRIVN